MAVNISKAQTKRIIKSAINVRGINGKAVSIVAAAANLFIFKLSRAIIKKSKKPYVTKDDLISSIYDTPIYSFVVSALPLIVPKKSKEHRDNNGNGQLE